MTTAPKPQRLEARLSIEQKELISRAAEISGLSITDFVVQSSQQAALATLQQYQTWTLSQQDAELFVMALLSPPAPNDALKQAAVRSRARFSS